MTVLYPSAKVVLHDPVDDSRIYLIKRHVHGISSYEPAGGKIEVDWSDRKGESLEACARREAREEMGVEISIDQYIGSYHFFWSINPRAFSSCVLFSGKILNKDVDWKTNYDSCELPAIPESIAIDDLITGKIFIDPIFVGLETILLRYLQEYRCKMSPSNTAKPD